MQLASLDQLWVGYCATPLVPITIGVPPSDLGWAEEGVLRLAGAAGGGGAINDALNAPLRPGTLPAEQPPLASPQHGATPRAGLTVNECRIIGLTSIGHALCHASELVFAG